MDQMKQDAYRTPKDCTAEQRAMVWEYQLFPVWLAAVECITGAPERIDYVALLVNHPTKISSWIFFVTLATAGTRKEKCGFVFPPFSSVSSIIIAGMTDGRIRLR